MDKNKNKNKNKIKRAVVVAASAATILGLAFATPSLAASKPAKSSSSSSASSTTTAPQHAGKHGKGGHKGELEGAPKAGITKTVTVEVPADGNTYKLVVTNTTVRPVPADAPVGAPKPPKHSVMVAVTGTGSQTITINDLRPGTYSVELVAVSSTQTLTVDKPTTTPTPTPTPTR
jgi:hypothetical protein